MIGRKFGQALSRFLRANVPPRFLPSFAAPTKSPAHDDPVSTPTPEFTRPPYSSQIATPPPGFDLAEDMWQREQRMLPGIPKPESEVLLELQLRKLHRIAAEAQAAKKDQAPKERLPDVLWESAEEFSSGRGRIANYGYRNFSLAHGKTRRMALLVRDQVFEARNVGLLVMSLGAVYSFGVGEAALLALQSPLHDVDTLHFVLRYGFDNIVPGFACATKPAAVVALSMGLDPNAMLLFSHSDMFFDIPRLQELGPGASQTMSAAAGASAARKTIASTSLLAQLLRLVHISMHAATEFSTHVAAGTEPPFAGVDERVVRLTTPYSRVTEVSLAQYGHHVVPVMSVASPLAKARAAPIISGHSWNLSTPVFWSVEPYAYGYSESWDRLGLSPQWLIRTTSGRALLCLEADVTDGQSVLSLGQSESHMGSGGVASRAWWGAGSYGIDGQTMKDADVADLNENVPMAFRLLKVQAVKDFERDPTASGRLFPYLPARMRGALTKPMVNPKAFRTVRVYLGDLLRKVSGPGGRPCSLQEFVVAEGFRDIDVLVDSNAVVLDRVVGWCRRYAVPLPPPALQALGLAGSGGGRAEEGDMSMREVKRMKRALRAAIAGGLKIKTSSRMAPLLGLPISGGGPADPLAPAAAAGAGEARRWVLAESKKEDRRRRAGALLGRPSQDIAIVCLDTHTAQYFQNLHAVLAHYGITLVDVADAKVLEAEVDAMVKAQMEADEAAAAASAPEGPPAADPPTEEARSGLGMGAMMAANLLGRVPSKWPAPAGGDRSGDTGGIRSESSGVEQGDEAGGRRASAWPGDSSNSSDDGSDQTGTLLDGNGQSISAPAPAPASASASASGSALGVSSGISKTQSTSAATSMSPQWKIPRIVCNSRTTEVVHQIDALIKTGNGASEPPCCVLFDDTRGMEELQQILHAKSDDPPSKEEGMLAAMWNSDVKKGKKDMTAESVVATANRLYNITPMCSAHIHDDILRQVRVWARLGYSTSVIHKELEYRFGEIMSVMSKVRAAQGKKKEEGRKGRKKHTNHGHHYK